MANEVLLKAGTPIVVADATDWPSGGAHGFGDDDYQLDLTSVADGAARQSAKIDLGVTTATWARQWGIVVGIEFNVAPASDGSDHVDFYWSASNSSTAATGNAGGASGSDSAYQASSEAEWVRQLEFLGSLTCTADAQPTVQIQRLWTPPSGLWTPPTRYGSLIVYNQGGQALYSSAADMFVALIPLIDEIQ